MKDFILNVILTLISVGLGMECYYATKNFSYMSLFMCIAFGIIALLMWEDWFENLFKKK